ncbi:uncharacterized protein LOC112883790 isoform X4 [Panicum hallii]|uniref:uncharacterized protein LOC112883790 isoform X4 n=1 Tax=Panicum hallii TaxID=206008 RepID=UPI000DF4CC08|nr:uncharacterized protein LOC112883790 isoform X4 [Panicum hallii]
MSATAEGSGACRVSRSSRPCPTCRRSPRVPCLEFSKVGFIYRENARSPGYYDGRYWTMWKLPMFGCTDSTQVYAELEEAKRLDANLPEKRAGARFLGTGLDRKQNWARLPPQWVWPSRCSSSTCRILSTILIYMAVGDLDSGICMSITAPCHDPILTAGPKSVNGN